MHIFYSAIVFFRILRRFFVCVYIYMHRFAQSIFPMTWNWDQHEFNVYKIDLLIVSPHKL